LTSREEQPTKDCQRILWNLSKSSHIHFLDGIRILRLQQVNGMLPVDCIISVMNVVNVVFVIHVFD
jgi:hypothetical protein